MENKEEKVQIFIDKKEMPYSHVNMLRAIITWMPYLTNTDLEQFSKECLTMLDKRRQAEYLAHLKASQIPIQKNRHDT